MVEESLPVGTVVEQVSARDLDTGINAQIKYRIQSGSFDDFAIDSNSGNVTIVRELDYDRRNTYQISIIASDLGTPSLSGSTTLVVNIRNSNNKAPFFTPTQQRVEVSEDARIGTLVYTLIAIDSDIPSISLLEFAATEPITAVDKNGKETNETDALKDFFVIERNGNVIVNKALQREEAAVLRISVLVTDPTAPTVQQGRGLLVLTITAVNKNPPVSCQILSG